MKIAMIIILKWQLADYETKWAVNKKKIKLNTFKQMNTNRWQNKTFKSN